MDRTFAEGIHWIGGLDWNIRDFHSYRTDRGATYNSYLIQDEKTAVVDGVKHYTVDQQLAGLAAYTEPGRLDHIVCLHAEPDHASGLPELVRRAPGAEVVCSERCRDALARQFDTGGWKWRIVKSGDTLSLGRRSLVFLEAPMVHWPDSTFAYCPEERLLFSNDAFGQHFATRPRFADEVDTAVVFEEAKTYYANIVQPYAAPVAKALAAAAALDIRTIAPAHGLAWRRPEDVARIVQCYRDWSAGKPAPKVVVLYETMWEATARMAEAVAEGADRPGVDVKVMFMRRTNLTKVATEFLDAAAVAVGSSTINNQMMPAIAGAMSYLQGLRPQGKAGFAFGAYGWAALGGPALVEEALRAMKVELLHDTVRSQNQPTEAVLAQCRAAGRLLGERAARALS